MGYIVKPLVTEKMNSITEKFPNRFGFIVRPEANKLEIKKEVEDLYNVTVVDVNTSYYMGKTKSRYTRRGLSKGQAVEVTGIYCEPNNQSAGWARIILNGDVRYVRLHLLSETPVQ